MAAPDAERFDLVILGSGSTAFAAELAAQEAGKTAIMTESRAIGGTYVNRGCLPSKNLIEAARLFHEARYPRFPGLKSEGSLSLDFGALVAQKDEVIDSYRDKKYDSLIGGDISVAEGHARFLDAHTVSIGGRRLTADRFLIATGSRPVVPDIPGLETTPFLTSDLLTHGEDEELRELPASLLIVGGGYIALELGQMFGRFGSKVTIVNRNRQLLAHGYEPKVGRVLGQVFADEGITVLNDAIIDEVRATDGGISANVRVGLERRSIDAAQLLVAVGRQPNAEDLGLDAAGVEVNEQAEIVVSSELRSTSAPHVFAAGDVIGTQHRSQIATPVGARQGGIAARNALGIGPARVFDGRVHD